MALATASFIEREQERLRKIGSDRDVEKFMYLRKSALDKRTLNHTILINFHSEGKPHGCKFACSYCNWKEHDITSRDQVPSNEEIDAFLEGFEGYKVYLSGGGDPLYRFTENGRERQGIERIVDHLHSRGFLVNVITRELQAAVESQHLFNQFNFSVDAPNTYVNMASQRITEADVRVSCVWDEKAYPERYESIVSIHGKTAREIYIREDLNKYNFSTKSESLFRLQERLRMVEGYEKVVFFPAKICLENFYLADGRAMKGHEVL